MSNREMTTPRRGRPPAPHNRNRQRSITRDESRNQQPCQWQQQQQQQHTTSSQSTPSQSRYNSRSSGGNRGKLMPSPSATQSEQPSATNESSHVVLLRRILFDEDDMQRRTAVTQQLIKSLEESLHHGDPTQMQYESMQLVDMCILKQPNIQAILEMNRPHSSGLKAAAVKLISTLALYSCRLDIIFMWVFDYLQRWMDGDDGNKNKESKIWHLRVLRQTITDASNDPYCNRQLYELSPNIVASIIMFLDAMDTSDYLPEVLQVIQVIASSCPVAFSDKFQDMMDLLVGWHIDPHLSEQKRNLICGLYKELHVFWHNRLPFAFELLQHFLSDMHGVMTAIASEEDMENSQSKWNVCEGFFSCFHGMLQAIVPLLSTPESRKDLHLVNPLFDQLRLNTLEFLMKAKELSPNEKWMEKSNQVLLSLFASKPQNIRHYQWQVYQYFASQAAKGLKFNHLAYLKMLMKLVDAWGSGIDQAILQDILNVNTSPLFHLRAQYRADKQLNSGTLVLLRSLLRLCANDSSICLAITNGYTSYLLIQLTTITKAYQGQIDDDLVLHNIQEELKTIDGSFTIDVQESNKVNVTDAVVDTLFIAYLLLDAAAIWPSSRLHHLLVVLQLLTTSWKCKCSDIFDAGLQVVIEFCSSCHFLVDSHDELNLMSKLLCDLFNAWPLINMRSRHLLCRFLYGVVESLESSTNNTSSVQPVRRVVKQLLQSTSLEKDNALREDMIQLATRFCQAFGSTDLVEPAIRSMWRGLDDPCPSIRKATANLVAALNPFILTDTPLGETKEINALKNIVMATPHTGAFRPTHFEIVMINLGMAEYLVGPHAGSTIRALENSKEQQSPVGWAERLFYHCDSLKSMRNVSTSSDLKKQMERMVPSINYSKQFLSYWAMWESTRYCILSRLRTPFGGPEHTFAAFERMLSTMVSVDMSQLRDDASYRTKLSNLLLLLDRLEVQIYNASDGCATNALPSVPRSSLAFFRTNKKTCRDYYARIRPKIIQGARMMHDDHLLIRHLIEALKEREVGIQENAATMDVLVWFSEINKLICELVVACIHVAAGDLINGMQSWYRRLVRKISHLRPSFQSEWTFIGLIGPIAQDQSSPSGDPCSVNWFQVGAMFASGHHEQALKTLESIHVYMSRDDYGILNMLDIQALDYYTYIEDYDAIKRVYDSNGSMFSKILSRELIMFASHDIDNDTDEPTCSLDDLYSSMQTLNVTESLQLGRLVKFQNWLSNNEHHAADIKAKMDQLLTSRAQLSLEGPLPTKCSMLEMELAQRKSILQDMTNYIQQAPHIRPAYDIQATKAWGLVCNYLARSDAGDDSISAIHLYAARAARKQQNLEIAQKWLSSISNIGDTNYEILYESVKVLLLKHESQANIEAMAQLNKLISNLEATNDYEKQPLYSKACLTAANLLKDESDSGRDVELLVNQIDSTLTTSVNGDDNNIQRIQSPSDALIHTMLNKSINDATTYSKPWFMYATHFYKQGWRILDDLVRGDANVPIVTWAKSQFRQLMPNDENIAQTEKHIFGLIQKHAGTTHLKDETAINHALEQIVPDNKEQVLHILEKMHVSIVDTFRSSVSAYFRYLSLDEETHQDKDDSEGSTSMIITATLRLLRMLVKYGEPLQDVFFEHIERVRIEPWKRIIPQLFARLNHPTSVVQQVIGKLLTRICDEYPREIIYDVIVSSSSSKTNHDTKHVLARIANRMMEHNEALWTSTQRMAEELEKITVLWEERWSYKIASLAFNAMELLAKLDQEVARLENNKDNMTQEQIEKTFSESYDSVTKFLVTSIEKLLNSTILSLTTKTTHEQWFIDTFGKQIMQAYDLLQKPKSMATYREGWDMFIRINRDLVIETHKVRILELEHISPYLASLRNTEICVPGVYDIDNPCFIDSFGSNVVVLPTKTKPKKLDLCGSDGKKYSYLFKGMEDLHLDERVMQLLDTVNGLLSEDKAASSRDLKTRTYAVIPLSDHSGMIQWVNDATPLFALYKRWQRREQTAHALITAANDRNTSGAAPPEEQTPPQRPTEMFMAKVERALRAENLRMTTNRRHWPKHILKKVFLELVKETPGDLLGKEMWCSSADSAEWLAKTTSFSRSLAVMSVIGYIIGLGDRHLDNMMVDYHSGEIIHIDYNVCFEKGRQLRVPELVPFRLTQNLFHALGISGVDGIFRIAAEETLRVLRKHKEVLMTLLDAFVYDPLVHWENDAGETEERQMMELQANLGLVATRLGDKKLEREEYEQQLPGIISNIQQQLQQAMQSEPQNVLDETSDDDREEEDDVDVAKRNIMELTDDCKNWNMNHKNALLSLIKGSVAESLTQKSPLDTDMVAMMDQLDDGELAAQIASWTKQRDGIYHQCAEELLAYKKLVRPVAGKLLDQDSCRVWNSLQDLSTHSFEKEKVVHIQQILQQSHISRTLQALQSRAFNFASHISQTVEKIDDSIQRFDQPKDIVEDDGIQLQRSLQESLIALDGAFRRLDIDGDENSEETQAHLDLLPATLQAVESCCHLGSFGQSTYICGLLVLSTALEGHVDLLQRCLARDMTPNESSALQSIVPCATALFKVEDTCMTICGTILKHLLAGGDQGQMAVLELQKTLMQGIDNIQALSNEQATALYQSIMSSFEAIDHLCSVLKDTSFDISVEDLEMALNTYANNKRQLILCILGECVKHVQGLPTQGWTSYTISSWAMTYNAAVAMHAKQLSSTVTSSLFLPFISALLQSMRQQLNTYPDEQNFDTAQCNTISGYIQNVVVNHASKRMMDIGYDIKSRYNGSLDIYKSDIDRFLWFNAPYLQSERPLFPSQLPAQMADGPERFHYLENSLQALNDMVSQSQTPAIQQQWQQCYRAELEKCAKLIDLYDAINHLENCREGYTQAMIVNEYINNQLQSLVANNMSENGPAAIADETSLPITSEALEAIHAGLSQINELLATLQSPLDGIVSLLESITIIEVDDNNELKPIHQNAKDTLDQYHAIKSSLKSINKARHGDKDWTYSSVSKMISEMGKRVQSLFAAFRTLEEFGLERPGDEQKQIPETHEHQSTSQNVEISSLSSPTGGDKSNNRRYSDAEAIDSNHQETAYTSAATQRRDAQVLGIMRRVRSKLEGRDFGVQHKMSVHEQIAKTIEQSLSVDNLCAMYEGWTSWV
ncbi:hypothetical protein K492DRAFT_235954 [Lichtheimia hyalospora FSU 10163]|nr:hypothetical protein K492DRAFT_235954 [Lichtheimia hyalospora FSU 10163]